MGDAELLSPNRDLYFGHNKKRTMHLKGVLDCYSLRPRPRIMAVNIIISKIFCHLCALAVKLNELLYLHKKIMIN